MDEYDVDGTMKKLFGYEIDCLINDKFVGSNEESKIPMEVLYETDVNNVDNMDDKIASGENNASIYNQNVPSRIVETFGNDIISHRYITNLTLSCKDVYDGKYQNRHEDEIIKIDCTSLKDIRKALDDQRARELGSKRKLDNINYLLNRIRTHAYHLLVDAGWFVERHKTKRIKKRPDNAPVNKIVQSVICISPKGLVHKLLSGAWVACGEELLSKLSTPNCDEIGKMWFSKNEFYLDMVYTLAFVDKEERRLSLLIRWQLLDPFMAAIVIDKKVSALAKDGVALKAINSRTYIVEINSEGNHEKVSIEETSNASSLQYQMENSLASNTEKECHECEIETSTQENSCKEREIEHPTENGPLNKELTIRGNNVKRVLNLKPDNTVVRMQEEESGDTIQQTAMISRDVFNPFVMNQAHVYTKTQLQSIYLYHSLRAPYFYGTHDINSLINRPQTMQSFLYHKVPEKSMQQAMQTYTYPPVLQRIYQQKLFYIMNSNEASSSKKLKKHKQKRSKKLSEIKEAEEIFSENNASDENINQAGFINPQEKTVKSKESENEESFEKGDGKAWRMVVEDSLCFVEDDTPPNETNRRHAESETKPFKRYKSKKNKLCKEEDIPLPSNVIKSKSCEIIDDVLLISAMRKKEDTLKYYRKRKNKSRNINKPSLRRREECDVKKPRTVLCWLIEKGVVSENEVIQLVNSLNNALQKEGVLRRNGIICNCCNSLFCVSNFRLHASREKKYYSNLFVGQNKTYTLCQLEAWSAEYTKRKDCAKYLENKYEDHNDDSCALCGYGGDLVCCDGCPSSYHTLCLPSEIQELPEGSWYCHRCTCSVCGDTIKRVEPSASPDTLTCQQCEQKYHQTCIGGEVLLKEEVESKFWFCGDSCKEVCIALRSRIGEMTSIGEGFYYTILRCNHGEEKFSCPQKITSAAECHTKLAVALDVVEECFNPWIDSRTGIHVIPHILYNWGSNFARLNCQGFHTVVLEKEDEIICVASIRVHGVSVAEIPLISTCNEYRRQGMCRRLMVAIEQLLKSLKVELLVLSAVPELVDTWKSGFGYKRMESKQKKRLIDVNLMSIPGTVMLQKSL